MKWRDIYKLLEAEKKKGKLSKSEKKRLKEFKKKKAKLNAMPQNPCLECRRLIPSPLEFCSSKCRETYKKRKFKEPLN